MQVGLKSFAKSSLSVSVSGILCVHVCPASNAPSFSAPTSRPSLIAEGMMRLITDNSLHGSVMKITCSKGIHFHNYEPMSAWHRRLSSFAVQHFILSDCNTEVNGRHVPCMDPTGWKQPNDVWYTSIRVAPCAVRINGLTDWSSCSNDYSS